MLYIYTTDDPTEATRITKSLDMACFIHDLMNIRRDFLKYADLTRTQSKMAEKIFDRINDAMNDNNIVVDELL